MNRFQRSDELTIQKLTTNMEDIRKSVSHNEAFDLIEYFEIQNQNQQKRDKINLIISIISAISSICACIIGLFQLFNS